MDGDRIEIELVPTDGGTRRSSCAPTPSSGPPSSGPGSDDVLEAETPDAERSARGPNGRRTTVAVAAGVGLVALLLGWMIGRSGTDSASDSASAPGSTTAETSPPSTEPEAEIDPSETIAPLDEPRSSGSWPPVARQRNATDLVENGAAIDTRPVEIDERLVGQNLRLVGLDGLDVAELDLAAATVSTYVLDGLPRSVGSALVAGDDWIMIPMYDGLDAFVLFDDGTVGRADVAPDGSQLLHVDGTDRFWRGPEFYTSRGFDLQEVDLDGEPTGRTIALPYNVWAAFADPRGGVVVQSSGRWFSVDENGSTALGVGEVIALDADTVVLNDCVALDDCGLWRVDRASGVGERVPVDLDRLDTRFLPAAWWSGDAGAGLSPDGGLLATTVETDDASIRTVVIDLASGELVELEDTRPGPPALVWTDDSRFLISLSRQGAPTAHVVETGETFEVVVDDTPVGWNTLTARP